MPRFFRRITAVAVLLGAWALVGNERAPLPLTLGVAEAGQTGTDGRPTLEKGGAQQGNAAFHELSNSKTRGRSIEDGDVQIDEQSVAVEMVGKAKTVDDALRFGR